MSTLFLDGDLICYKIACVGQETSVKAYVDGEWRGDFKNLTEARKALSSPDGLTVEQVVVPKPISHVKKIARAMINNIFKASGCADLRIYIDGAGNFRESVATIKKYKGQRPQEKPYWFYKVREWLIKSEGAVEIKDIESDDAISIAMYMGYKRGEKWVGGTIDKDAKNTCGWLFNWDSMTKPEYIDELTASKNFWCQMLSGDTVDNIQGCRGVGKKNKYVDEVNECTNEADMFKIVYNKYLETALNKGCTTTINGDTISVSDEVLQNGNLLWMLRGKPKYDSCGHVIREFDDVFYKL